MNYKIYLVLIIFTLINSCTKVSEKKNTIVLSFCSLSRTELPYYNNSKDLKNFKRVFDTSFVFKNAYSNVSWSNLKRYMARDVWKNKYRKNDHKNENPLQVWSDNNLDYLFLRIPSIESADDDIVNYYKDNRLTSVNDDFNLIKQTIDNLATGKNKISIIHFKFMHYPYLSDELYKMALAEKYLDISEIELIEKYRKNPQTFPDKKVFFQVLFAFKEFENFFVKDGLRIDLSNDKSEIFKWKKSIGYEKDFKLLKKIYFYRLNVLDAFIGKVFDYYKENYENKLNFVLTGDHGESFMEHDSLTHSGIPYDEAISFFYSLHMSGQNENKIVDTQLSQKAQESHLAYLTQANPSFKDFKNLVNHSNNDGSEVYSYNCSGDISSLRIANKWKGIYNIVTGEFKLFDLLQDPFESSDVSNKYPDISLNLMLKQSIHLEKLSFIKGGCINSFNF
jgi:hypothetical protein